MIESYRKNNARIVNKKKFPISNIYVFKIKDIDLYKIGVSNNTKRRHSDIDKSMPFNVIVLLDVFVPDAYELELYLHSLFKYSEIKSEWFCLNKIDLDDLMFFVENWNGVQTKEMIKNPNQLKLM